MSTRLRTVSAGPWPQGMNNTAPEGDLPRNEAGRPAALREADNIDLSKEGRIRRRDGYSAVYKAQLAYSLWSGLMRRWMLLCLSITARCMC